MKAVKIKENIYWVGGIDWNLRNFHGYMTQRGSTYNAYLITDKKTVLIDTVKHYLYDEMLARISDIIDPKKIDYVISNHVEMDHSGSIPRLTELIPNATVVTSSPGEKGLRAHYGKSWNFKTVKTGDKINIGARELTFVMEQMVHWPDNMATYSEKDKIIFSNDAFGQHIASSERFDTEYPLDILIEEARKYYANIVLPYGSQVQKVLEALKPFEIDTIAPSHGIIWTEHIPEILNEYVKWAGNQTEGKCTIVYDTMWQSTEKIAMAIKNAFENKNIRCKIYNLKLTHISDIMSDVITSKYICLGSPTLNNNILPTVSSFLTYLKGLAPKNRAALAFGSFGWSGQSVGIIENIFKEMGLNLLDSIKTQYVPDEKKLKQITEDIQNQIGGNNG
ncbi:MAG: FprA family A-type flavoprotein [bacterium]|nr:FprA family A-type flavoprotein [bacterium]